MPRDFDPQNAEFRELIGSLEKSCENLNHRLNARLSAKDGEASIERFLNELRNAGKAYFISQVGEKDSSSSEEEESRDLRMKEYLAIIEREGRTFIKLLQKDVTVFTLQSQLKKYYTLAGNGPFIRPVLTPVAN